MRPKSKAELTAEIKTLQTRIHNLEAGVAAQRDTTAAPHLREQEFRDLLEHSPDIITRFDSALRHTYVSPAVQVMTGLPPQAFIGKSHRELGMPQDLAERWEAALRQVFETGQEVCIEFVYTSPDGPRAYESRLFPERVQDGAIAVVFSISRDVTDRKRAEEMLRESAARLRSLWEYSTDGILLTAPDGRILMASPAACLILGRSEEEICRIGRAGVVDQTDPQLPVLLEERARTGKSRGELRLIRPDGTTRLCEITSAVFTGWDGLPWTSMCIHDISERNRAEISLRESEERYRAVLEDQTEVICRFHADGKFTYVNDVFCRFFGKTSQELYGQKWQPEVVPDDLPLIEAKLHTLSPANPVVVIENRIYSGRGEIHWMQFVNRGFFDSDGRLLEIQAVGRDITENKRAEEKLRESEAAVRARADELAMVFAATPALTFIAHDPDCRHMTSSLSALRLLRLPADTNTSKSASPGERPETFRVMKDGRELRPEELPVQLAAAIGQPVKNFEFTFAFDDDTVRDIVGDAVPLFDAEGKVRGAVGAFLDITERKRAEEALRIASLYARSLIEASLDPLVTIDLAGKIMDVNVATEKATGVRRQQLIGSDFANYFTDPDKARAGYQRVFDQGNVVDYPLTICHTSGRCMDVLYNASLFQNEQGKVVGVVAAARDITQQKEAEGALRRSQTELKAIYDNAPIMMCVLNASRQVFYANRAFAEFVGRPLEELTLERACGVIGCLNALDDPRGCGYGPRCETCAVRLAMVDAVATGRAHRGIEYRMTALRGGYSRNLVFLVSVTPYEILGKFNLLMCLEDITERKRAEEALLMHTRQLEAIRAIGEEISRELDLAILLQIITERSAELMGAASGVVALWDEAAQILVPHAWFGPGERTKDLRWKPGEDLSNITEGITHTAALTEPLLYGDRLVGVIRVDREANRQPFTEMDRQLLALFATQAAIAIENARLYAGVVRRIEEIASLLRASRSLMAGLDLQETLSRIAEEAARITRSRHVTVLLRDREKGTLRLGAVVDRSPVLLDSFARVSNESLSEIVASTGQPLFVADCAHDPRNPYADEDRALGIVTYLGQPITIQGEVVGVLTVNTTQPWEYTSKDLDCLVSFANLSAIAIENARLFEDVRTGRERLQALSRRQLELQESERRLLARELHDEIGQLLTGLKLTLDMLEGKASDADKSLLRESQDLVGELIGHVRELSLDLRPALLDDLGLLPALLWQFERYAARTQIQVDFQHAGLERRPCPSEVETAAYRIVQEALTNVARHAGVDLVHVRIRVEREMLLLQIEDEGHGFEPTMTLLPSASSGLAGMHERATLLGGRLRIDSSPGAGARIQAELPLGEPERSS